MKLLICTQKVDKDDPILGFFHTWVARLAGQFESITVICLEKGVVDLPENVGVYSLGKEAGAQSRMTYTFRFLRFAWNFRNDYDKVFVHMNQEYIVLAGLLWQQQHKPIYFWRNHPYGNVATRIAVMFSKKVFFTSRASFTARFRKAVQMPAGVDTFLFQSKDESKRKKYSVLMVGRIAPVKHIEEGIQAIALLVKKGVQATLTIVGNSTPLDGEYEKKLHDAVENEHLSQHIHFIPAVKNTELTAVYSAHEICLNLTDTGSFDKTIVEAASCGTIPVVSNTSLRGLLPDECVVSRDSEMLATTIQKMFEPRERLSVLTKLPVFVEAQKLDALIEKLVVEIRNV